MDAEPDPGSETGSESSDDPDPAVTGDDRTAGGFAELDRLTELARATLIEEGITTGALDLVAVDIDEMAALNAEHMGHEGPTDVLSFPLDADDLLDGLTIDDGTGPPVHLGDIVICPEVARVQAPDHCGTEEAEFALLVIHGVLHILGHDHAEPEETAAMQARERHHLAGLGYRHPGPQEAAC